LSIYSQLLCTNQFLHYISTAITALKTSLKHSTWCSLEWNSWIIMSIGIFISD